MSLIYPLYLHMKLLWMGNLSKIILISMYLFLSISHCSLFKSFVTPWMDFFLLYFNYKLIMLPNPTWVRPCSIKCFQHHYTLSWAWLYCTLNAHTFLTFHLNIESFRKIHSNINNRQLFVLNLASFLK